MSLFAGARQQARNFSCTAPKLGFHARRCHKRWAVDTIYNVHMTPGKSRSLFRPDPLHGNTNVLWNSHHEDHPWDDYGNPRPMSTFSERGMAIYRMLPHNRRLRQFVNVGLFGLKQNFRCLKWAPKWLATAGNYKMPPHMIVAPGHRPMTEHPSFQHPDFNPWLDLPNVKRKSPIENSPHIFTKHADDRAKKMDLLKFKLAASNFRVNQRAKYESENGDVWMGGNHSQKAGGNRGNAPPSPLWTLRYSGKAGGEVFSKGTGVGSFPRPTNRWD
eukprot:TRINITY_DN16297_c0_g1_i1.p1 TRINITY_DN16297_c0_g1~~TRINITY_DN16297_c0_g1_i1.p1  ORF type:complete len:273 (+),score=63.53 TRINITY_DN16297_c0_g1_i1:73-891(+)